MVLKKGKALKKLNIMFQKHRLYTTCIFGGNLKQCLKRYAKMGVNKGHLHLC